jgi:hypothetical protein
MATSAALIALALLHAVGTSDATNLLAAPGCHGPSVGQMTAKLAGVEHFEFTRQMLEPFLGLWAAAQQPQIAETPDSVTVFAGPRDLPLILVFGHRGCALALLRAERSQVWRALGATIGPAI